MQSRPPVPQCKNTNSNFDVAGQALPGDLHGSGFRLGIFLGFVQGVPTIWHVALVERVAKILTGCSKDLPTTMHVPFSAKDMIGLYLLSEQYRLFVYVLIRYVLRDLMSFDPVCCSAGEQFI